MHFSNFVVAMSAQTTPAPAPVKKSLPFHYQFLAGGVAGTSEILIMYPLDVVKTRFQLQSGAQEYTSVLDCFRKMIAQEGASRLYRGIIPPIMMEAPKRATKFAANEQYTKLFTTWFGTDANGKSSLGKWMPVATGVSAGCTEAFIVVPFDLVKIRLQDKHSAGKYKNTVDCVRQIIRDEGPLAFFKGLETTLWRHGVWSGAYFGTIGPIKSALSDYNMNPTLLNFVAGVFGGTFGTILNTPFDVVKTRIQNNAFSGWAVTGLGHVAAKEGFGALWKGFVPKVMRLGPGGGIMLVMFDAVSAWIQQNWM